MQHRRRPWAALALSLALAPGLAACSSSGTDAGAPGTAAGTATTYDATTPAAEQTDAVGAGMEVLDAWTAARPDPAANSMTGVFGIVRNTTNQDIELVSATNTASDRTELHQTVTVDGKSVMQQVESMKIPSGGSLVLQPGGDHVMVMNLAAPIQVGDTVTVTLRTKDGQSLEFPAVAKQFTGANEPYHSPGSTGMGTDMGSHMGTTPAHTP